MYMGEARWNCRRELRLSVLESLEMQRPESIAP